MGESTQPPQQTVDPRTLLQQCQRASRMVVKGKKTKNPPVLSHEFVIQNHADIVACVAMVFVVGLMFQISSPAASVFIALHHNVSVPTEIQCACLSWCITSLRQSSTHAASWPIWTKQPLL